MSSGIFTIGESRVPHNWVRRSQSTWFCAVCGFEWIHSVAPTPASQVPETGEAFEIGLTSSNTVTLLSCEEYLARKIHDA